MSPRVTYNTLITTAGLYLVFKQRTAELWFSFLVGVNAFCDTYDALNKDTGICDGTLMCTRVNARHKSGCLAKW